MRILPLNEDKEDNNYCPKTILVKSFLKEGVPTIPLENKKMMNIQNCKNDSGCLSH